MRDTLIFGVFHFPFLAQNWVIRCTRFIMVGKLFTFHAPIFVVPHRTLHTYFEYFLMSVRSIIRLIITGMGLCQHHPPPSLSRAKRAFQFRFFGLICSVSFLDSLFFFFFAKEVWGGGGAFFICAGCPCCAFIYSAVPFWQSWST